MSLKSSRKPVFVAVQSALLSLSAAGLLAFSGSAWGDEITISGTPGHSNALCGNSSDSTGGDSGSSFMGCDSSNGMHDKTLTITGSGTTVSQDAYGAYGTSSDMVGLDKDNGNILNIKDGATLNANAYGAYSAGTGSVIGGQVNITGDGTTVTGNIYGGYASNGSATGNTVTLTSSGTGTYAITGNIIGGYADESESGKSISKNNVKIEYTGGGSYTITGNVIGGASADSHHSNYIVSNNTVELNGVTVKGYVIGGAVNKNSYVKTLEGNTVTLRGGTRIEENASGGGSLYGSAFYKTSAYSKDTDYSYAPTGNTLNVYGGGHYVQNDLANFAKLNFYLPQDTAHSAMGTQLEVGGTAYLDGATIHVGIDGGAPLLQMSDQIVLISAAGGFDGTLANNSSAYGTMGVTLEYTFDLKLDGNGLTATVATAPPPPTTTPPGTTCTPSCPPGGSTGGSTGGQGNNPPKKPPISASPRAKALSEGFLSGMAHVRQGQETLLNMLDSKNTARSGQEFSALARLQGGSARHDSGSSIRVNSRYLSVGTLWQPERNDRLSLAGLLELGEGDYHSRNHFDNRASVKGRGDMESAGAAVLARWNVPEMAQNAWLETSVRGGHIRQDFKTHDLVSVSGRAGNYHLSTSYWGAHVGIGNRWEVAPNQEFDARAQLLWSQEKGGSVTLKSGDPVKFRTTDSERLILGGRYNWKVEDSTKLFVGLAWEHEFSAKAKATAYNLYAIDAPDLKGSTGVAEFGVSHQTGRLKLDAGVNASGGKREGFGGFVQANWKF